MHLIYVIITDDITKTIIIIIIAGICDCYPGWGATYDLALYKASDCSAKICPTGRAWADIATNVDTAHALVCIVK
jgi:hypothetical protein